MQKSLSSEEVRRLTKKYHDDKKTLKDKHYSNLYQMDEEFAQNVQSRCPHENVFKQFKLTICQDCGKTVNLIT